MPDPLRVLLVEDSEEDALLLLRELRRSGYEPRAERVETAEAMRAALEAQSWDLILADYNLPHFSAEAALAVVQELALDVPFLVVSGEMGEETAVDMMRAGAHDYLMKDKLARLSPAVERELHEVEERRERRRAELQLMESEGRFRSVFDNVSVGMGITDRAGVILAANRAGCRFLGRSQEEVAGRHLSEFAHPEDIEADAGLFREVAEGKRGHYVVDKRFLRKDGQVAWGRLTVSLVRGADRRPERVAFVCEDITERKQLEGEILRISETERQSIGQDLHDSLGQQLVGIRFMSHALQGKLAAKSRPEAAEAGEIEELTVEAVKQVRGLSRGLCPVEPEEGGLASALEQLADSVERSCGISCALVCEGSLPACEPARALHLYRIAQEAVSNAVRHGKASHIVMELTGAADGGTLSVRDDGVGLPEKSAKSKGLGVRIMKHRASAVGGSLEVRAGNQGGTVVLCSFRP